MHTYVLMHTYDCKPDIHEDIGKPDIYICMHVLYVIVCETLSRYI